MSVATRVRPPAPVAAAGSLFHPAVASWLATRFGQPTEVQARACPVIAQQGHALIAAPTGSGKTLAAFLSAINELVIEGLSQPLGDEVHVLYVSPLKALSNDIRKNLQEPLDGICAGLLGVELEQALAELVAHGLASSDSFAGLRALVMPGEQRRRLARRRPGHDVIDAAGRWSLVTDA